MIHESSLDIFSKNATSYKSWNLQHTLSYSQLKMETPIIVQNFNYFVMVFNFIVIVFSCALVLLAVYGSTGNYYFLQNIVFFYYF